MPPVLYDLQGPSTGPQDMFLGSLEFVLDSDDLGVGLLVGPRK